MQTTAAALTMVRDDLFFLKAWLRHYGETFGRENCYIINHGRGQAVAEMAEGCNIIGIPGDPHPQFDMKRWRMLNNLTQSLRNYYTHVVVGDVDELVVVDPELGGNLLDFLANTKPRRVLTPVGLEVIHRIDVEHEPITDAILGPRRHVRLAPHYSKPCILSIGAKIARGGHYTEWDKIYTPDALYLMHLKFCDFGAYVDVMNHRNAITDDVGVSVKEAAIGRHWFPEARGEDRAVFEAFETLEMKSGFNLKWLRGHMQNTFAPRGETGFWQFDQTEYKTQYQLPERFNGVI